VKRPSIAQLEQLSADDLQVMLLDIIEVLVQDWGRTPRELSKLAFEVAVEFQDG
jgi:hypothetical protein